MSKLRSIMLASIALSLIFSTSFVGAKPCIQSSPFAIFGLLVDDRLAESNELWNCILCSLPEELTCTMDANVCNIQKCLNNAASTNSPIYANGQIFKARALMKDLMKELGIDLTGAKIFTEADNDTFVYMEMGRVFYVQLEENSSTGYAWELTVPEGLELHCDKSYVPTTSSEIVGAGGTHTWSFSSSEPGVYHIAAVYKQSWMQQSVNDKTFELTIIVQ